MSEKSEGFVGVEGFVGRHEGLKAHLPGAQLPWLATMRELSAASFRQLGFPTQRNEAWKYTNLSAIAATQFGEPLTPVSGGPALPAARADRRAVFVDGRFRPDLSTLDGAPYRVESLAAVLPELEGVIGDLARPDREPMAALNTALFEDGLFIDLAEGVEGGEIELLSLALDYGRPAAFHPRHLIRLAKGASLTLIESAQGTGKYLHNPVFEISVAEKATLVHGRLQQESREGFQLATVYASVESEGTYDNFVLNAGGKLVRNEIHVGLLGTAAAAHLNGVQMLEDGQHADSFTALDHAAPNCPSRQTYKSVLSGRSKGVFQGKILVRQAAQKTDGYQMNQALLLSDEAEIDSKPQLEIYADDVKCSHGATAGALDEDALFFLRSRGIPQEQARAMLVEAFLVEAVEVVNDPKLREVVEGIIGAWRPKQQGVAA
ncbi:Fe-S cluster assembly protein SufD [Acetobacteraceae bacterium H6797]|nr:Fe-S cluster assembly protein SufD [Acetobacteraceae bacterium H6797]